MTDLAAFLLDRIADDEAVARAAAKEHTPEWVSGEPYDGDGEVRQKVKTPGDYGPEQAMICYNEGSLTIEGASHIACWDPARVLAECQAKRQIVEEQNRWAGWATDDAGVTFRVERNQTLCILALPYADHPGYREEWRP